MIIYVLFIVCAAPLFEMSYADSSFKYKTCPKQWIDRGCSVDFHRNLGKTIAIDDRRIQNKIDWDNLVDYEKDLKCRCYETAKAKGSEWFAIMKLGLCHYGIGPWKTYENNHPLDSAEDCNGPLKYKHKIVSKLTSEECRGGQYRLTFYEISGLGNDALTTEEPIVTLPPTLPPTTRRCTIKSDVIVLVDTSGSIGTANLNIVKGFLKHYVERYTISRGNSRIAIVHFDSECYVDMTWVDSDQMTKAEIKQVIDRMKYTGGSTVSDVALTCAKNLIIRPQQRQGIRKTVVMITDGESHKGEDRLPGISKELREGFQCTVVAIGIGPQANEKQLELMTGAKDKTIMLANFQDLDNPTTTLNKLIGKTCS